jgi:branched-chain amino acid transport system substrate-binding protein
LPNTSRPAFHRTKRFHLYLIRAGIALGLLVRAVNCEAEPLRVGVVSAVTGNAAAYGGSLVEGIRFGARKLDTSGKVSFIYEDDGFQPKNSLIAASKLLDTDKVQMLIVFGAGPSAAVAPVAEARRIPMISVASIEDVTKGRDHIFRFFASPAKENVALSNRIKADGVGSIAIAATTQEAMLKLRDLFVQNPPCKIAIQEEVLPGETEVKSIVARIRAARPDAVYLLLFPSALSTFARGLREAGYQGSLYGAHQVEDPAEVKAAAGALSGTKLISVNAIADSNFEEDFRATTGDEPGVLAPHGHDLAKIVIDGASSADFHGYLKSIKDFHGVMGAYGLLPDRSFDVPVQMKRVTADGRFAPL